MSEMNGLDNVVLTLKRGGHSQTHWLCEISHLTDDDIAELHWADVLVAMLEADPVWEHANGCWWRGLRIRAVRYPKNTLHLE